MQTRATDLLLVRAAGGCLFLALVLGGLNMNGQGSGAEEVDMSYVQKCFTRREKRSSNSLRRFTDDTEKARSFLATARKRNKNCKSGDYTHAACFATYCVNAVYRNPHICIGFPLRQPTLGGGLYLLLRSLLHASYSCWSTLARTVLQAFSSWSVITCYEKNWRR